MLSSLIGEKMSKSFRLWQTIRLSRRRRDLQRETKESSERILNASAYQKNAKIGYCLILQKRYTLVLTKHIYLSAASKQCGALIKLRYVFNNIKV